MPIIKKILLISISLLFIVTHAHSQPQVNHVEGLIQHNENIRISGSYFGSYPDPAPIIYDDFENGIVGNSIADGGWLVGSDTSRGNYSTNNPRSGTQSAHWHFDQDSNTFNNYYKLFPDQNTIYATIWRYDSGVIASSSKCFRSGPSDNHYDGHPRIYNRVRNYSSWNNEVSYAARIVDGSGVGLVDYLAEKRVPFGQWFRIEFFMQLNTYGQANGSFGFGVVGQSWDTRSSQTIRTASDQYLGSFTVGQAIATVTRGGHVYVDDIYVSNTLARVEIGNNSIFENCTHREIQVASKWTDDEIEVTFKQGTFAEEEDVYLFVVDSDGNPSPGYGPIAIGGGEARIIDDSSLAPPGGLSISID